MNSVRVFLNRLASLFRRKGGESELDRELRAHLDALTQEYVRRGMSQHEARHAARRDFGGVEQAKELYRDQRRLPFFETLFRDARFALRMMAKNRGFTSVAVLTLALGIGANTAIFSVVEALLLRPLTFVNPEQLVMVWEDVHLPYYQTDQNTPAPGNFSDWRNQNRAFSSMGAMASRSWNLSGNGEPLRVSGEAFSAGVFSVLQTYPMLGRAFSADEDRAGGPQVAILSYGLWVDRFAGDPSIIGRSIQLDQEDYEVVGVMPKDFRFPDPDDQLYVPLALSDERLADHGSHYLRVIARLKPGVSLSQAQSAMTVIARRLSEQYPDSNTSVGVRLIDLREQRAGNMRRPLLILMGVAGLLLLMVCANVANLLLARASARGHEFAVRSALGASRSRVLCQLLVESMLLALLGGAFAVALALWGIRGLQSLAPASQDLSGVRLNSSVGLFAVCVSLATGLLFGIVPALQSARRDVGDSLKQAARDSVSYGSARLRRWFVIGEMALGVVVLIGAGLLLRSFVRLEQIPLGFNAQNVLSLRVVLSGQRYSDLARRSTFYVQAYERIRSLPGVRSVAGISFLPLSMQGRTSGITIEGQPAQAAGQMPFADFRSISPGYFETMRIPVVEGRDISWRDNASAPLVVVVSEAMADSFWPRGDAIGKRIKVGGPSDDVPWITVVGIAGNVRQLHLIGQPRPAMYFSALQDVKNGEVLRDVVVRTSGDPAALTSAIRSAIGEVDSSLPISRVQTMERVRSVYLGPQRFNLLLVSLFGLLALLLAAVGLYGVVAYSVAQRRREIGLRIALGARPTDVFRIIVGQGIRLTGGGLALGVAGAWLLVKLMRSLLYGIEAHDMFTFVSMTGLLFLVALAASFFPARRATRVDPVVTLRYE